MYSIVSEYIKELEVEHSRFIGIIKPLTNKEDIKQEITKIKKRYPKAKHYCYAGIIGDFQKSSDDGEPQGTAGRPMLDLLIKNNFSNVLLVVVRYFGGTLLGAARLLRTYVDMANLVIKTVEKYAICQGYLCNITTSYMNYDNVVHICKDAHSIIENTEFNELITLKVFVGEEVYHECKQLLYQGTMIEIIENKIKYKKVEE